MTKIQIAYDAGHGRVWHGQLAEKLRKYGHEISFYPVDVAGCATALKRFQRLLRVERRLYGAQTQRALADFSPSAAPRQDGDIILDLSTKGCGAAQRITLAYNGVQGEAGALAALIAHVPLVLSLQLQVAGQKAQALSCARPGIEDREILGKAMTYVAVAAAAMVQKLVRAGLRPGFAPILDAPPASPLRPSMAYFVTKRLAIKMARQVRKRFGKPHGHWRVGWRKVQGDDVKGAKQWAASGYQTLADDGSGYFADPFLFQHQGLTHVFCEEYPYATQMGVISAFTIDAEGRASKPVKVLERPYHLSYPQVFQRDGEIYMIPETGANHTIELYRAVHFPHEWQLEKVLVDQIHAGDATFIEYQGRCWIFASIVDPEGSSWDQLGVFHAPDLLGPWQAHSQNPLLIDASCARPAGQMWVEDGVLWRVAQDCGTGYGRAVQLVRVDQLTPDDYLQTAMVRLAPKPEWQFEGLHTLNSANGVEMIDFLRR
ncbi:MAG: formyl transferase [Hyphomicrobiales bacterium]|nr:formyl transferase [Hyphomicrobiales bacterium]MDE2115602.1 formyl transferase [Hyphomicrobiales bacterium]